MCNKTFVYNTPRTGARVAKPKIYQRGKERATTVPTPRHMNSSTMPPRR
jgi:hypothetical protein